MKPAADPLSRYRAKRDFERTEEPPGDPGRSGSRLGFVIQKHAATRLHYDFRLELDGVLLSWAVPKGPSYDPSEKRMAIEVEAHPLSYARFEGRIPPGQYGAGTVIVWDEGWWTPEGDPREALQKGKLVFTLHGQKMQGRWELVRIARGGERQPPWLLFKKRDAHARTHAEFDVVSAWPDSVLAHPLSEADRCAVFPAVPAAAPTAPPVRQGHAASSDDPPSPGSLPGARKAALPTTLAPQLASLASALPAEGEWRCELKLDGYRLLIRIARGRTQLLTRSGLDWSDRMPHLVTAFNALGLHSGWLDGEIVVLGSQGTPDFHALQNAFDAGRRTGDIVCFLFDVPYADGHDLRAVPLKARRAWLQALLTAHATQHDDGLLRFSADFDAPVQTVLGTACALGLEGVMAKRQDAPYVSARTGTWLKLKCRQRQEFVVCGYAPRSDDPDRVGALLLGVHDAQGRLVPAGNVGTGWSAEQARALRRRLAPLEMPSPPFDGQAVPEAGTQIGRRTGRKRPPTRSETEARWLRPQQVAEVAFSAWTPDHRIRHATFIALRDDKPVQAIVREHPRLPAAPPATARPLKVTHGERVLDAASGVTKLDLVRYYAAVADRMLPHLQGRPCALLRAPEGVGGALFFQRHGGPGRAPELTELDPALWPGHAALLSVDHPEALVAAAQWNAIEFHTWNAPARHMDRPDRMVFDLDPGEGTAWPQVQEGALLVRTLLEELGLACWLKTSGGKGLHVVVPIVPRWPHEVVKALSKAMVQHLARTLPSRFVARSGPANRVGRIFVDYLRNGHAATTVAAFSARARPGLGVSMPVAWDDLPSLRSGAHWTVQTAREHLSFQSVDPWADYARTPQALDDAMAAMGLPSAPAAS